VAGQPFDPAALLAAPCDAEARLVLIGGMAALKRDAVEMNATEGVSIQVASLADVIRSKSAADREKDRLALPRLHELLERSSEARRERG
jgi:hypothetical protein